MPSTKTPSRLLKLKGSRRLNHGKVEPVAEAVTGSLSPPADLSVAERKMWNNVCGRLEGMGILASSDVELLYCYVSHEAGRAVHREQVGRTVEASGLPGCERLLHADVSDFPGVRIYSCRPWAYRRGQDADCSRSEEEGAGPVL